MNVEATAPINFPVILYLNQRVVFDTLAIIEDGFSQLTTTESVSMNSISEQKQINVGLGISSVFALISANLSRSHGSSETGQESEKSTEQRIHTPNSLFARLRQHLIDKKLLNRLEPGVTDVAAVGSGEFVEFKTSLRQSPFVTAMQAMLEFSKIAAVFQSPSASRSGKSQPGDGSSKQLEKQLTAILNSVSQDGSADLVGQWADSSASFVLTSESSFFINPTLNDVLDGEFWVLGKVTRVVKEPSDTGINLLRRTPLNYAGPEMLQQFVGAFENLKGFAIPPMETHVKAPALQVIPLAVFA